MTKPIDKTWDERIAAFMKTPIVSGMYEAPYGFELSDKLMFSSDWNWLMSVVVEIQRQHKYRLNVALKEYEFNGWGVCSSIIIFSEYPYYYYWADYDRIEKEVEKQHKEAAKYGEKHDEKMHVIVKNKFEAVYQCVCRFIEWWEKQDRKFKDKE